MTIRPITDPASIPLTSLVLGYGPMVPLAAAAVGSWTLPAPWPAIALALAIIWGALILALLGGVRRGFGFGDPAASTTNEIVAMLLYFVPAGIALVLANFGAPAPALALLIVGYGLVLILDRLAGQTGDAPPHFARLRGPQMGLALASFAALLVRELVQP